MKDLIQKTILGPLEKMFFNKATVITKEYMNESFIYFELDCVGLRNKTFNFGDFISISLEPTKARSYTPISYDSETGFLSFLYYSHGPGVADEWMRKIKVGESFNVFGPRKSMNFSNRNSSVVFIGDETSIGLAASLLRSRSEPRDLNFIFEVNSIEDTAIILKRFGIIASLYKGRIEFSILNTSSFKESQFLITGNSETVKNLRKEIKEKITSSVVGVPYWIPGKAWR